jgi:hypothetical protein
MAKNKCGSFLLSFFGSLLAIGLVSVSLLGWFTYDEWNKHHVILSVVRGEVVAFRGTRCLVTIAEDGVYYNGDEQKMVSYWRLSSPSMDNFFHPQNAPNCAWVKDEWPVKWLLEKRGYAPSINGGR